MKTNNKTTQFLNYNPEFFQLLDKVSKKSGSQKGLKKALERSRAGKKFAVPKWAIQLDLERKQVETIRCFKPIPIGDEEFKNAMGVYSGNLSFSSDSELYQYAEMRWKDFCVDAVMTLKDTLKLGRVKFGNRLDLGRINYAIFDRMISRHCVCVKEEIDDVEVVGYDRFEFKHIKYSFVKECGFPTFNCDGWWRSAYFPIIGDNKPLQIAEYTSMTIVTNTRTNRVYANWEMQVHSMIIGDNEGIMNKTV